MPKTEFPDENKLEAENKTRHGAEQKGKQVKIEDQFKGQALKLEIEVDKPEVRLGETVSISTLVTGGKAPYTFNFSKDTNLLVRTKDKPLHVLKFLTIRIGYTRIKVRVVDSQGRNAVGLIQYEVLATR